MTIVDNNNKVNELLFLTIQSGKNKEMRIFTYILQLFKRRCPITLLRLKLKDTPLSILCGVYILSGVIKIKNCF